MPFPTGAPTQEEADRLAEEAFQAQEVAKLRQTPEYRQQLREGDPQYQGLAAGANGPGWTGLPSEQPPTGGPPDTSIPTFPGITGTGEGTGDVGAGAAAAAGFRGVMFDYPRQTGPAQAIMGERSNFAPAGGEHGLENFNEAGYESPRAIEEAIKAGAQATAEEGQQKANFYKGEKARAESANETMWARYRQDQANIDQQMADMAKKTEYYTNDLADRGQFWRNPGNIIASFGAALIGAAANDPTVGIKIINNAINADLSQRKYLADMHLGQLRSNVGLYRQLAGDRLQGDMLAESEAKRVAAMELERISNQFAGPKAKAAAAAMAGKLRNESAILRMDLFNRIYHAPQAVPEWQKREYEAAAKGLPAGVGTSYFKNNAPKGPAGATGVPVPGAPAPKGAPTVATPAKVGAPGSPTALTPANPQAGQRGIRIDLPDGTSNTFLLPSAKASGPIAKLIEERAPGTLAAADAEYQSILRNSSAGAKNQRDFINNWKEHEKEVAKGVSAIAQAYQKQASGHLTLSKIQSDMKTLDSAIDAYASKGIRVSQDDLMRTGLRTVIGAGRLATISDMYDAWIASDPQNANKWKAAKRDLEEAGDRLGQLINGRIADYYTAHIGGSQTTAEQANLRSVISQDMPYAKLRQAISNQSQAQQAEFNTALNNGSPAARMEFLINTASLGARTPKVTSYGVKGPGSK